jgi:hypothetical protein
MAQFFKLTYPPAEDDFEFARLNPAWIDPDPSIPAIPALICVNCGRWTGSGVLRIPLPSEDDLGEFKNYPVLKREDWFRERPGWAQLLGIDASRIEPGDEIGPPRGLLKGIPNLDFIHPFPGRLWVRSRVMEKLKEARCTGVEYAKVEFVYRETDPKSFCDGVDIDYGPIDMARLPDYWELVVTGTAWREGQSEETILLCALCGREGFPSPERMKVDESRWDGSDFFTVDRNPNIVLVTERVCNALSDLGAANYFCKPLD